MLGRCPTCGLDLRANVDLRKDAEGRRVEIEELNRRLELARRVIEAARNAAFYVFADKNANESVNASITAYDAAVGREGGK